MLRKLFDCYSLGKSRQKSFARNGFIRSTPFIAFLICTPFLSFRLLHKSLSHTAVHVRQRSLHTCPASALRFPKSAVHTLVCYFFYVWQFFSILVAVRRIIVLEPSDLFRHVVHLFCSPFLSQDRANEVEHFKSIAQLSEMLGFWYEVRTATSPRDVASSPTNLCPNWLSFPTIHFTDGS